MSCEAVDRSAFLTSLPHVNANARVHTHRCQAPINRVERYPREGGIFISPATLQSFKSEWVDQLKSVADLRSWVSELYCTHISTQKFVMSGEILIWTCPILSLDISDLRPPIRVKIRQAVRAGDPSWSCRVSWRTVGFTIFVMTKGRGRLNRASCVLSVDSVSEKQVLRAEQNRIGRARASIWRGSEA